MNLPGPATPLLGRETEIRELEGLLRREGVRLVTLTGPGGSGKTRLGIEIASRSTHAFPHGVFFVDLAPLSDPALVPAAIAGSLGIKAEMLEDFLGEKQVLLLVDNFEHVIQAATAISELLATCPVIKILVTSRESLRLRGEHELPVPPLLLPEAAGALSKAEASKFPAVNLFVQRAQALDPHFSLSEKNAPVIAEICRRLDGLPLAIELAAARTKLLAPEIMLQKLDQRLKVLTVGARDLPSRQQTLRATLDWSYQLLKEEEQRLFRRMAVFSDGGTLPMIQNVAVISQDQNEEVWDCIAGLVEKNMLRRASSTGEETRFTMLETVREYALEKLEASGEADNISLRHAEAYLRLAEKINTLTWTSEQAEGMDQLERERGNLREALRWSESHDPDGLFLGLASALWRFWSTRGPLVEGRGWLDKAVMIWEQAGDRVDTKVLLELLTGAAGIARFQGDSDRALEWMWKALEICRQVGDDPMAAEFLHDLAIVYSDRGDYEYGLSLAKEAVEIRRRLEELHGIRHALESLCFAQMCCDQPGAARASIEEALQIARASGSQEAIEGCQLALIYVAIRQGQYEEAQRTFEEYLPVARDLEDQWGTMQGFFALGCLAATQGQGREAAWLLGAAEQVAIQYGYILEIPGKDWFERTLAATKNRIGESLWNNEYEGGRTSIKELRTLPDVLSILENYIYKFRDVPKSSVPEKRGIKYPAGMTAREVEILKLVAQGLTDNQIAETLVISPRTVNAHLTSIYNKLDVNSRTAAARIAIDQGLA